MYREAEVTHAASRCSRRSASSRKRRRTSFVEPDKDIGPAIRHLDEVRPVAAFFEGLGRRLRRLTGRSAAGSTRRPTASATTRACSAGALPG